MLKVWCHITAAHSDSVRSSFILSQMLIKAGVDRCLTLCTCSNGAQNTWIQSVKDALNTLTPFNIVYIKGLPLTSNQSPRCKAWWANCFICKRAFQCPVCFWWHITNNTVLTQVAIHHDHHSYIKEITIFEIVLILCTQKVPVMYPLLAFQHVFHDLQRPETRTHRCTVGILTSDLCHHSSCSVGSEKHTSSVYGTLKK